MLIPRLNSPQKYDYTPNLVAHLVDHPDDMALGGRRQQCSFVFTDIAGFTSLMEDLDPAHAVSLLNAYLDRMIAIAFAHGGTLERIIAVSPDRLSIYNYAHLPTLFKPQRRILDADLPAPEARLEILSLAIDKLTDAGYVVVAKRGSERRDDLRKTTWLSLTPAGRAAFTGHVAALRSLLPEGVS